jgi:hypothetical protein
MMGLTAEDLAALGMGGMIQFPTATLDNFRSGNIQHIEIRTQPDGAYIYVNNEPLPRLIWDTQLLANAVDLYARLSPDAQLLPLIQQIAPYLDRADLDILLRFPATGQPEIPAELH